MPKKPTTAKPRIIKASGQKTVKAPGWLKKKIKSKLGLGK